MKKIRGAILTIAMFGMLFIPMSAGLATVANAQSGGDGSSVVGAGSGSTNLLCKIFPFLGAISGGDNNATSSSAGTLCGDSNAGDTTSQIGDFLQFAFSLVFIGIIAVAIFYIIKSAIKYIRSEGDEAKVQESQKAIKAVFVGVAALFVGIIGLVVILIFFNATTALEDDANSQESNEESTINELLEGTN